jgi:hypothetical protein
MKRNFDAPMVDPQGNPYADDATLKTIAFMSLQAAGNLPGDERMTVNEKLAIYRLTNLIVQGGMVDLTSEDLSLLKDRIGKAMNPMAVGRAFEMLDEDPT